MSIQKTQFYSIKLKKQVGRYSPKYSYYAFKQDGKYIIHDISNQNIYQQVIVSLEDIESISESDYEPKGIIGR